MCEQTNFLGSGKCTQSYALRENIVDLIGTTARRRSIWSTMMGLFKFGIRVHKCGDQCGLSLLKEHIRERWEQQDFDLRVLAHKCSVFNCGMLPPT